MHVHTCAASITHDGTTTNHATCRWEGVISNPMPNLGDFPFDYDTIDLNFWTVSGKIGRLAGRFVFAHACTLCALPLDRQGG